MRKWFMAIVCLMTMVLSVNAQNAVVDEFTTSNEPTERKFDYLLLDPNKSIVENYAKIDSLMSLHKERNYAEYTIMVEGHYTNKRGDFYDWHVGTIQVKGKDNEYYITISGQIIKALTELYSHSLDTRFNVEWREYNALTVNQKRAKVETGRTFKHNDGKITKEYVEKEIGGNTLYYLYSTSSLYKKIKEKVISETGLQDGGKLYEKETLLKEVLEERSTNPNKVILLEQRSTKPNKPISPTRKTRDDLYR